jgi:hypothetical protein
MNPRPPRPGDLILARYADPTDAVAYEKARERLYALVRAMLRIAEAECDAEAVDSSEEARRLIL